jgi:acetyltransferase-like isoleucine patch superfamily enzyme
MNKHKRARYRLSTYKVFLRLSFYRRGFNRTLHMMARVLPGGGGLRPFLHRLRGVKIHGRVYIGDDVYLDEDNPESVEIHDEVVIAHRCTIIGHTRGVGKIVIEKQAAIAAGCLIVCGPGQTLTIGEGAVISAGSTVSHDIPLRTGRPGSKHSAK